MIARHDVGTEQRRRRVRAVVIAASGVALLVLGVILAPAAAGGALILALMLGLSVPLGSAVLLAVHALTGGDWGRVLGPSLRRLAAVLPVFVMVLGALAFAMHAVYPWARDPLAAVHPDVARLYLDQTAFVSRALLIVAAFGFLAWTALRHPASPLLNAVALIGYAVGISFAAVDWVMSLEPRWSSSVFAALVAVSQIGSALALVAILGVARASRKVTADVAQLMIACILGVTYLFFMQYLVIWSGNLPDKVSYFVLRIGWTSVIVVAFAVGSVLPLLLLVMERARESAAVVASAGGAVLSGLGLLWLWQVVPVLPARSPLLIVAMLAATCGMVAGAAAWQAAASQGDAP